MKRIKGLLSSAVALLFLSAFSQAQILNSDKESCMACEELKNLILPDVIISQASQLDDPVSHCKILGIIGKEIHFELLLPKEWNARFVMGGNGGFAGAFNDFLGNRKEVSKGYATGLTDTGHKGNMFKADWALDNMERQLNFGHLAVHRTAVVSKEIIRQYYCSGPAYSYFYGCSGGGGQAMSEAQRYPNDFDGIVAGAPAINWPAFSAMFLHNANTMYPDPTNFNNAILSKKNLELLQTTILEYCDANDGISDQILNDPTDCDFDIDLLPKCPEDVADDNCFTSIQINAIREIYAGVKVADEEIHSGFPFGCENDPEGWLPWIVGPDMVAMEQFNYPTRLFALAVDMFKYLVFQDPNWDYNSYDFSNLKEDSRYASSYLDATSTNYNPFKDRGGKMILYHGWNDPAQSAFTTIDHYNAALKEDGQLGDYIKLFLLPGVVHCGGGPGPSQTDWIELVRAWVEQGIAPERVILSKTTDDKVSMTRPVFPYPNKAVYDGKGDPYKESSFNKSTTTNKE